MKRSNLCRTGLALFCGLLSLSTPLSIKAEDILAGEEILNSVETEDSLITSENLVNGQDISVDNEKEDSLISSDETGVLQIESDDFELTNDRATKTSGVIQDKPTPIRWYINGETLYIEGYGSMPQKKIDEYPGPEYGKYKKVVFRDAYDETSGAMKGITSLPHSAFSRIQLSGAELIEEVTLPNELITIANYAFNGCSGLKSLELPSTLVTIGCNAFESSGLESITIPAKVKSIDEWAFGRCNNLKEVVFAEGMTSFGDGKWKEVFVEDSLDTLILPESLKTIKGNAVFSDCKIKNLIFMGKPTTIDAKSFTGTIDRIFYPGTKAEWEALKISQKAPWRDAEIYYEMKDPKQITVTFISKGKELEKKSCWVTNDPTYYFEEPERDDEKYIFDGWYLDDAFTKPYKPGEFVNGQELSLYAKWREAKLYTATFYTKNEDTNDGWKEVSSKSVYEGCKINPPEANTLYPGEENVHIFWYLDETMTSRFNDEKMTENISLYGVKSLLKEWSEEADWNGPKLTVSMLCTERTEYDGRKHVVGMINDVETKDRKKPSASVNPDIEIREFVVSLDGKVLTGITIGSFSYENNVEPSESSSAEKTKYMYIHPTLKYDSKDANLQQVLKENKKLKQTLLEMMKPKLRTEGESYKWSYKPISVCIKRIDLTDAEVYTTDQLKADKSLQTKDGILVWNGKKQTVTVKTATLFDRAETFALKAVIPGLYYQKVFQMGTDSKGNTKYSVKKINLRAGEWKVKKRSYEGEVHYEMEMISGKPFDYFIHDNTEYAKNSGKYIPVITNDDYDDFEYPNKDGSVSCLAKAGRFEGSFPNEAIEAILGE